MFKKKITNKQGIEPNPRIPHHKQGLTCDCKGCGTEFTQYHKKHIYCSEPCMWDHKKIEHGPVACNDCGCVDDVPYVGYGYVCRICKMFRLNKGRTDIKPRTQT